MKHFFILPAVFLLSLAAMPVTVGYTMRFAVQHYDHAHFNKLTNRTIADSLNKIETKTGSWEVSITEKQIEAGTKEYKVVFCLKKGVEISAAAVVELEFENWNRDNYVLMPAAVYNGNRFESRRIPYSPKLNDYRDIGRDKQMIISDVPRLNIADGVSRIQERSGSMASPSIGFHASNLTKGFFLTCPQANQYGDYGMGIEENRNRTKAVISLTSPLVREIFKYQITDNQFPSDDKPRDFIAGDEVAFTFRTYTFKSERIQDLFTFYTGIRTDFCSTPSFPAVISFSNSFDVLEKKFNSYNFVPEWGYYSVGGRNIFLQDWQIGWTGGMISTYPLLFSANEQTRKNVIANFEWLFPNGISPSGFFWDSGEKGNRWYGGDIRKPQAENWHLIRKSADAIYYILKQFDLMKKQSIRIDPVWEKGTRGVAEAFVKLWKKNGQFGQFVDSRTGEIAVGGSTGAGIAPAALAMAAHYYNEPAFLYTALESAQWMYEQYILKGISCGGVGDALQNPDSESWYAVLESFAVLYDATGDKRWLTYATETAAQLTSWVMSYDYVFPANSLFGRMNMHATGAVFANTQNKHGSPGICTHSGLALLRLYRHTGNDFYLQILKEIAHSIPQYMATTERPIEGLQPGWINERVSTTDWFEGIGEVFPGSTWAETALLLTIVELPGVYVDLEKKSAIAFDHVEAKFVSGNNKSARIKLTNPTQKAVAVTIIAENKQAKSIPWKENKLFGKQKTVLQPGETKTLTVTSE
jgi:hypothetical protein